MPGMTADYYGSLAAPNIARVVYAGMEFAPWYGSPAYFSRQDHSRLGFGEVIDGVSPTSPKASDTDSQVWLDRLFVCHYCFQYTGNSASLAAHLLLCDHRAAIETSGGPTVGQLIYWDRQKQLMVRRVRGAHNPLFCQNLALFGKFFLDDKSVFYYIDHFDFYVLWGRTNADTNVNNTQLIPLGFFSKEVLSWDNTNNLACICVFPPFQRRRLGWLLIEISYAVAKCTPGQFLSGPEFPLSPFGRASYLRFWSVKLAHYLTTTLTTATEFDLDTVARATGFRLEDILFTLSQMKVLDTVGDELELRLGAITTYCTLHNIDPTRDVHVWDPSAFTLST